MNLDTALAPRLALHEHRHGQDHTASARLLRRYLSLEGAMNGDRQDSQGGSTPSRAVRETQMDAQNEAVSPLG